MLLLIPLSTPSYGKVCSLSSVGTDQYHIKVENRDIRIIGWAHLDPVNGQDLLVQAINDIARLENKTCKTVEERFNKTS